MKLLNIFYLILPDAYPYNGRGKWVNMKVKLKEDQVTEIHTEVIHR
jgi:hypothetical protein